MTEAGLSPKEVQVAAGHGSVTTTFGRYGHVMPGTLVGQRERLADSTREASVRPCRLGSTPGAQTPPGTSPAPVPSRRKPRICGAS